MPRKVEVEVEQPFGWSGKPIFFDDSTNEYLMRRESIPDMIKMAKQPDPAGRILLHEELQRAQPNEDVIDALLNLDPKRIKKKNEFGSSAMHVLCQNIHSVESGKFEFQRSYRGRILLYTRDASFCVEWCIRQLRSSSIISCNITSIAYVELIELCHGYHIVGSYRVVH